MVEVDDDAEGAMMTTQETDVAPPVLTLDKLQALREAIPRLERASEADAVDQIQFLEELKAVAAAGQAMATADLARMRAEDEADRGVPAGQRARGLMAEVALARKEAPTKGDRHLGLAKTLVHELPRTLTLMSQGLVSEWRATILAQETVGLSVEQRREVDAMLAPDLPTWGDRQVRNHARKAAFERDEGAAERRRLREKRQRHVSVRPATGSMAYVSALLPMTEAVRVHASLLTQAGGIVNSGNARGRTPGQIAADLLVEHVTGTCATEPRDVDLTIVMTDRTLAGGNEPAWLPGHGPVAASVVRDQLREATKVWFRRLWTDPATGGVVSMESRARVFGGQLRRLILLRDDACTGPFCSGGIRHVDHATPYAEGGATSADNASGLCETHNYVKNNPGWRHELASGGEGLEVRTPTGHRYRTPRSPFPYRRPTPPPEMTRERYEALKRRVEERTRRPEPGPEPQPEPEPRGSASRNSLPPGKAPEPDRRAPDPEPPDLDHLLE
ncbi:HNH endonuclease [Georgenia sp. Z1491]|uniref:HNH endonuclease n=1 Tax=Georgenia sp. Z1491 TaxID=3416707 RepID=UPI003CFAC140